MSFYDEMAGVARELLAPDEAGGLGATAGTIVLTRIVRVPPANSWENPTETPQSETLLAQAFGVGAELVGLPADEPSNGVVLASDRMVISAVPAMGYRPGDLITIGSQAVAIIRVENIPAAGTVSAVKFVVR